jgi:membrane associated rhomboid family serine protease
VTEPSFDVERVLASQGPLPRETALAALDRAAQLVAHTDFRDAARLYQRVIGFDDPAVTGAAYVGFGEALYRMDEDAAALQAWEEATRLPENPSTYVAWRNVAAGRVRNQDLRGAFDAYREADRRAPEQDRPEIANRLGWLSKELGNTGASGKYFARARGDLGLSFSIVIIGITSVISLVASYGGQPGQELLGWLALDKAAVADGQLWRLWTVTLVHDGILHLGFNMWALWIVGPFVEQLYGRWRFLALYLVCALGGSLASFWSNPVPAVGASGAIFGLFGLLVAVERIHRPAVNRNARQLMTQMGPVIVINLVFGFIPGMNIDNAAHIGGLLSGLWLGFLFAPTRVPTLRSMWMRPSAAGALEPAFGREGNRLLQIGGLVLLLGVYLALYLLGLARY